MPERVEVLGSTVMGGRVAAQKSSKPKRGMKREFGKMECRDKRCYLEFPERDRHSAMEHHDDACYLPELRALRHLEAVVRREGELRLWISCEALVKALRDVKAVTRDR